MKRLLAVLACLLIGLVSGAQTESLPPLPTPMPNVPSESEADGAVELTLDGATLSLLFDGNPLYSMRQDGYVQASFYGQSQDQFYELYLLFPDSVQSGDEVSSQSAAANRDSESGILLYITGANGMAISIATQSAEGAYPAGSSYRLSFDSVIQNGGALTVSGTLEAVIADVDAGFNPLSNLRTLTASFSFTLNSGESDEIPEPNAPSAAPTAPTFLVTPPDAQRI